MTSAMWQCDASRPKDGVIISDGVVQAEKQEGIRKRAKLDAFERQNVAAASSSALEAVTRQGEADAAKEGQRVDVDASGHAIKANEDRARSVKVGTKPAVALHTRAWLRSIGICSGKLAA